MMLFAAGGYADERCSAMNTGKPQIVAVFRPPLLTQAVSCVIILFQLIILVFGKNGFLNWLQDFQGDFLLLLPGIGLLIVLWMLASLIIVDKLLITEEGLIWRRFGFKHRVSWNEMKYFGFSQRLIGRTVEEVIDYGEFTHVQNISFLWSDTLLFLVCHY